MSIETIVIIGAGQAGASAILELRANGYIGKSYWWVMKSIYLMNARLYLKM